MSCDSDGEILSAFSNFFSAAPSRVPLTSLPAGVLMQEVLYRALDALWSPQPYELTPWEQALVREAEALADAVPGPDAEWAVTAAGWRLVIYDGAIAGIEEASP